MYASTHATQLSAQKSLRTPAGKTTRIYLGTTLKAQGNETDKVEAEVTPAFYNTGTSTNATVRPIGQALKALTGYLHIAGHLLNNHLGGTGQSLDNIATFSHQDNMNHKQVEAPAKASVQAGNTIVYGTAVTERSDVTFAGGKADHVASKMTAAYCEWNAGAGHWNTPVKQDFLIGPHNPAKWSHPPTAVHSTSTGASLSFLGGSHKQPAQPGAHIMLAALDIHQNGHLLDLSVLPADADALMGAGWWSHHETLWLTNPYAGHNAKVFAIAKLLAAAHSAWKTAATVITIQNFSDMLNAFHAQMMK